ncbi:hypothetical protein T484DRAFT_2643973 [Baffinella frigidus]|nr:hypothetical protein T484DRAFT_2643973 [Cryptophyta sp. CCMP2293]
MLAAVTGSFFSCCGRKPKEDMERFCCDEFRPGRENENQRRGVGEEPFQLGAAPTVEQRRQRRVSKERPPAAPAADGGGWGTGWLPNLPQVDQQAGPAWLQNLPGLTPRTPRAEKAVSGEARGQEWEALGGEQGQGVRRRGERRGSANATPRSPNSPKNRKPPEPVMPQRASRKGPVHTAQGKISEQEKLDMQVVSTRLLNHTP